jgi:hypothetical protein
VQPSTSTRYASVVESIKLTIAREDAEEDEEHEEDTTKPSILGVLNED